MIRLKRWGTVNDRYFYIRPSAIVAIWGDDRMVCIEVAGREDEYRVDGTLADVAAKLGITLTD